MMKLKRSYFSNAFVPKYLPVIYFDLILHFLLIMFRVGQSAISAIAKVALRFNLFCEVVEVALRTNAIKVCCGFIALGFLSNFFGFSFVFIMILPNVNLP